MIYSVIHNILMYSTQLDGYSGYYEVVNLCSNGIVIDINYRNTEDIDVATQLDVFDEEFSADQETMVSEGGMDISNHKDVFRAVYSKVRLLLID